MKRVILVVTCVVLLVAAFAFAHYWINTQPVRVYPDMRTNPRVLDSIPARNKAIVAFIEKHGPSIAPTYATAVCTELVIQAIEPFVPLTRDEKSTIRIITDQNLVDLIRDDSPVIRGVQTALLQGKKGTEIKTPTEALAGDFVQFWNVYQGSAYGHCGIVAEVSPGKSITLYSSHPMTHGYGRQEYRWPDKVYFVRLR